MTTTPLSWVDDWLSPPRFAVHVAAAGGNRRHALRLYEWNGSAPYVRLELLHGATTTDDPHRVRPYTELRERLWAAAVVGPEVIALIGTLARS